MKNKLAGRLALFFSTALLLLTLIVGILFIVLFRNYTITAHKKDMAARAEAIAVSVTDYMSNESSGAMGHGNGTGKGMGGYGAYLKFIDDIAGTSIWLVDENLNLITNSISSGPQYNYADLPEDAELVVGKAFEGSISFSEGFSGLLNSPTLTVATPITVDGKIVGAVLLHAPLEGISASITQGITILALSMTVALLLTILMSILLASKLTAPLRKMTAFAATLAAGDYSVKTGIFRNDEIGELAGSIDILSLKLDEARRATEKLETLRRDFVANVSHELRTPVTVLRGSLEALNDGVVTDSDQVKHYYRQMLNEILSLQRLVNDLMDLSRLQNTEFKIDMTQLNLCDVLSNAVRSARQIAGAKNIDIRLACDTQVLLLNGDYNRLRQMFFVVLDNAVKFSPDNSTVLVSLENGIVRIRDQGSGILTEDLPYIFDRFYKTKSDDNKTGSGLGLAIAKQIAGRHDIYISVNTDYTGGTELLFKHS